MPAVGPYSLLLTEISRVLGLGKQPSMSSSTYSGFKVYAKTLKIQGGVSRRLFTYLRGTLAKICPLFRLLEETVLAGPFTAPDYSGRGTRGVKAGMGKMARQKGCGQDVRSYQFFFLFLFRVETTYPSWAARNWR